MAGPLLFDAFVDESSQNDHRYLVLGGVILPASYTDKMVDGISGARQPELPQGEMKWGKVSRFKLPAYGKVVDLFFSPEWKEAHFHALVVDTSKQNNRAFNQGSREIGFNKELFQLASKFGRIYPKGRFHIYPDHRETDQRPEELRLILNRYINKKSPDRDWPYRRVQFRDSSITPLLQLTDIMSGALAYILNGHDRQKGASPAKIELASHILGRAGVRDVTRDTRVTGKFTIWHRQLRVVP
jgi:hypothetical protein